MAAAIFVDPRARVEARRRDVADRTIGSTPTNDNASQLIRSKFRPVKVVAIPPDRLIAHVHSALEQKVDRDGRIPGPVRSSLANSHDCGRLMISASHWPPPPHNAAAPVRSPRRGVVR